MWIFYRQLSIHQSIELRIVVNKTWKFLIVQHLQFLVQKCNKQNSLIYRMSDIRRTNKHRHRTHDRLFIANISIETKIQTTQNIWCGKSTFSTRMNRYNFETESVEANTAPLQSATSRDFLSSSSSSSTPSTSTSAEHVSSIKNLPQQADDALNPILDGIKVNGTFNTNPNASFSRFDEICYVYKKNAGNKHKLSA